MKRYFIEKAQCGVSEGGFGCGPIPGQVVASVQFSVDGKTQWISNAEVEGISNIFLTDEDVYERLIENDSDEKFIEFMNQHFINEFEGIQLGDYMDCMDGIYEDKENPAVPLIRYLITLTRCSMEEIDGLVNLVSGKYIDEVEIPTSDVEQDYLEERADEDEDDDDKGPEIGK